MRTKEEINAYAREWRAKNPGQQKIYYDRWAASHVEQERERQRKKYLRTREAVALRSAKRYLAKGEIMREQGRTNYKRNRSAVLQRTWEWRLFNDFGITADEYHAMNEKQDGVCAICKKLGRRRLGVDHCHATGKVRGLLCHSCNIALGLLKDSIVSAEAVVAYLKAAK